MEATNNSQRVAKTVNNQVIFSDGIARRPNSGILLPNGCQVLCRAGKNNGASALISRRLANKLGISYLLPTKTLSGEIHTYSNREVRDAKGRYLGEYIGGLADNFASSIFSGDFYMKSKEDELLYFVNACGEMTQVTAEEVVDARLTKSYKETPDYMKTIRRLAQEDPIALKGALELLKLQNFNPEEIEKRKQQEHQDRLHNLAYRYGLILSNGKHPSQSVCEEKESELEELSEVQLKCFEKDLESLEKTCKISAPSIEKA